MAQAPFPFGDFLAFLKQQGFSIGIDHYLRLQTLLNLLGPECAPDDLKFILCPIFAVNEKQQRQFHAAFDRYFEILTLSAGKPGEVAPPEPNGPVEPPPEVVKRWPYFIGVLVLLGIVAFVAYFISISPAQKKYALPGQQQAVEEQRITYHRQALWYMALAAPAILFLVTELYRRKNRRLILERQRGRKPPFVWPLKCEVPELGFLRSESFYLAMRRLKRRLTSDVYRLDIDETINSTIRTGGFPIYRYKALTKPPEYLMLVDLHSARDHYSHLIDHIINSMDKDGVFVTRYFYDRDPRVCFHDYLTERVYLQDLQDRFVDCRLIVFGDGEEFLDPVSGDLENWISLFDSWEERVVLTPLHPSEWGWREVTLTAEFLVLPATVDGLIAMAEHLSGFAVPEVEHSPPTRKQPWGIPAGAGGEIGYLRSILSEDIFQWLCACAVFSELHYDLTLFLGALPCMPRGLLSEENLNSLFRLPWFRKGSIPDQVRFRLINELDPDKLQAIRSAIIEVLINNPPPTGTFARNTWWMNIVLQQWMLSPKDRDHLKNLSTLPESVGEKTILEDYTALQLIESVSTSPVQLMLPRRLNRILFRNGLPLFGFRTIGRAFIASLATLAIYGFMVWPVIWLSLILLFFLLAVVYQLGKFLKASFSTVWQALKAFWPAPAAPKTPVPEKKPLPREEEIRVSAATYPTKAWVVVFAGFAVNLCLGILYAWSVWAKALINERMAGQAMTGANEGWIYLTNTQAADLFMICIMIFTLLMIPGGKIQDKFGPNLGAITGGLFLAVGCIVAGLSKSDTGLILGFGLFGGIGMGLGYAAAMPAALKWFGPHKRGLAAGLVVGGYGAAALYVAPLGSYLINSGGLTYSFVFLGILFGVVMIIAGSLLAWPEPGYVPPAAPVKPGAVKRLGTVVDWAPSEVLKTWQLYALILMFIGSTQSGLMVISIAAPLLVVAAKGVPFLVANVWILLWYGGLVNASGRVVTGFYSDYIGRSNAYSLNCIVSAICLFLMPAIVAGKSVILLFVAVSIAYWQYGGGLSLMPSFTADFYGTKNLGMNYGLVFLGWGGGFFMARIAGIVKDAYGTYDLAFYMSGVVLIIAVILSRITKRPVLEPAVEYHCCPVEIT